MTASIVVFQFYPVTALMLVLLALLNDLPIMTIAYDNVKYSDKPEKWDMRTLLGIATFLGVIGVFSSFGIGVSYYDVKKSLSGDMKKLLTPISNPLNAIILSPKT